MRLHRGVHRSRRGGDEDDIEPFPNEARIPTWLWVGGLIASALFCTAVLSPMLRMKPYEPLAAVALALLVAVLAVRALGETDLVSPSNSVPFLLTEIHRRRRS